MLSNARREARLDEATPWGTVDKAPHGLEHGLEQGSEGPIQCPNLTP